MKHIILYACVAASWSGGPFLPFIGERVFETSVQEASLGFSGANDDFTKTFDALPPQASPLAQTHAHNDYLHDRPLFDALAQGFQSIEVDVHLIGQELYVSHDRPLFLDEKRSLKTLYLEPLKKLADRFGGRIYPESHEPLLLMIDIKTEAQSTYVALKKQLASYADFISSYENGVRNEKAVRVFLSGNRPVEEMANESFRLMDLDGRLEDLGKGYPSDLMPIVSENFIHVFGLPFPGASISEGQWRLFKRLSGLVHSEGKKMRLWASPEQERIWAKLLENGADFINTDELGRLRFFLLKNQYGPARPNSKLVLSD